VVVVHVYIKVSGWNFSEKVKSGTMVVITSTVGDASPPPRKRVRQTTTDLPLSSPSKEKPNGHRLFAPFRALGLITNRVPFVLQARSHKGAVDGPRVHLLTCLGKSWAMWEGDKMSLLFVGK
jgi:U3 small nucleolar RNA-associated protein 21